MRESEPATRFLHDEVGQALSAAGLQLDLIRLEFGPLSAELSKQIDDVQLVLEGLMERVRAFGSGCLQQPGSEEHTARVPGPGA